MSWFAAGTVFWFLDPVGAALVCGSAALAAPDTVQKQAKDDTLKPYADLCYRLETINVIARI